jgi:hypothetical protein
MIILDATVSSIVYLVMSHGKLRYFVLATYLKSLGVTEGIDWASERLRRRRFEFKAQFYPTRGERCSPNYTWLHAI